MSGVFTPGPWHVADECDGTCVMADRYYITETVCHPGPNEECPKANARLIAAAPALLEALRMAREMIAVERQSFADCNNVPELTAGDDPDNFVSIGGALFEQHDADVVADYDRALAQIDAAIAAATGGQA